MGIQRHFARSVTRMLGVMAMAGLGTVVVAPAAADAAAAFPVASCSVSYSVSVTWSGGFTADIILTASPPADLPSAPSGSGTLYFTFPDPGEQVAMGWGGGPGPDGWTPDAWSQTGQTVKVFNPYLTNLLNPMGFNGTWDGSLGMPAGFTLNGVPCDSRPVGPHQRFVGFVNGQPGAADLYVNCRFRPIGAPPGTGIAYGGQTVTLLDASTTSTPYGSGATGGVATRVDAAATQALPWQPNPPWQPVLPGPRPVPAGSSSEIALPSTFLATFTAYGTQELPADTVLPCSGTGTVVFAPEPGDSTTRWYVVPVTFVDAIPCPEGQICLQPWVARDPAD